MSFFPTPCRILSVVFIPFDIQIIFYSLQNLPELARLDLSYNYLKQFDFDFFDQVGTLTNLMVNVSHNHLSDLSDNTTSFINLREQGNITILKSTFNYCMHKD